MKKSITALLVALLVAVAVQAQSFKVIVNNANAISSLTKKEASNFFLKNTLTWNNGKDVAPADLVAKSPVREAFSKAVLGKNVAQVRTYWQQAMFAGKDTPPREFETDNDIIAFVKANAGAIGYVSASANTAGVKVITVN